MIYVRANTDWLAKSIYGVGFHWTVHSKPRHGPAKPFDKAVDDFDVKAFLSMVEETGAKYIIFTSTHAIHWLAGPNAVVDRIMPGRTCKRDLLMELAVGLSQRNIRLIFYYNHSCNGKDDPEWQKACGFMGGKELFFKNLCDILTEMGTHYAEYLHGYWFDSSYTIARFAPPWHKITLAVKSGNPDRIVCYNSYLNNTLLHTEEQDYCAGELNEPLLPEARYSPNGLQWHGYICLDEKSWVHNQMDTEIPPPRFSDKQVIEYVKAVALKKAAITFNLSVYQDGTVSPASIAQLRKIRRAVR